MISRHQAEDKFKYMLSSLEIVPVFSSGTSKCLLEFEFSFINQKSETPEQHVGLNFVEAIRMFALFPFTLVELRNNPTMQRVTCQMMRTVCSFRGMSPPAGQTLE